MRASRRAACALVLALLSLVAVPPRPAAAQYDCSDPAVRSALAYARQTWAQVIAQYRALPAAERQYLDQQMRRSTGYTVPQLGQLITECGGTRTAAPTPRRITAPPTPRSAGPAVAATPAPTPRVFASGQYPFRSPATVRTLSPAAYLAPATRRPDPAIARARPGPLSRLPLPAAPEDGVPIGSGALKLGWQLYGRTDLDDRAAAELYRSRADARIADLHVQRADAEAERTAWAERRELFDSARAAQNVDRVLDSLREDHAYFTEVRRDQTTAAALAMTGLGPLGLAGDLVGGVSFGHDSAAFAATLGRKAGTAERWTRDDLEAAASLAAGGVGVGATLVGSGVGVGISFGQASISLAQAAYADYALRQIDLQIQRPLEMAAAHRAMLASREAAAAAAAAGVERELGWRSRERDAVLAFVPR